PRRWQYSVQSLKYCVDEDGTCRVCCCLANLGLGTRSPIAINPINTSDTAVVINAVPAKIFGYLWPGPKKSNQSAPTITAAASLPSMQGKQFQLPSCIIPPTTAMAKLPTKTTCFGAISIAIFIVASFIIGLIAVHADRERPAWTAIRNRCIELDCNGQASNTA